MSVMPYPDHLLSLDEWDALPEDNTHHYELVEGVLAVSPRPVSDHQRALGELFVQMRAQLLPDLVPLFEVELVLTSDGPATVRSPDLLVVPVAAAEDNPARYHAQDALLAVEIMSPGSRKIDRVAKLFDYADAGIPSYWIIDIEPPTTMTAYRLVDGEYELVGEGSGVLELSAPAPLEIDVDALTTWRRP
jgi:Uma2 family endonuclease